MRRLIVGVTGASGTILAVRLLEALRDTGVETHLVVSRWAERTLQSETSYTIRGVQEMATHFYPPDDLGARISSGSFVTDGMVIAPCSMRSLAAIAHGTGDHLVHRAADVALKERRRLVLVTRETPLNDVHLENMLKLSRMGCTIMPPVPAFYNHPQTIADILDYLVLRILDQFNLGPESTWRWKGQVHGQLEVKKIKQTRD